MLLLLHRTAVRASTRNHSAVLRAAHARGLANTTGGFDKILIANRGEIACRIIRTARKMGIKTVAVYSDADAGAQFVKMADEAHRLGPPPTTESYLVKEKIVEVAVRAGAQALHPGYGFLSENADFAQMCNEAGVAFIGPPPDALRSMASKSNAKKIMTAAGVPVTPAYYGDNQDPDHLAEEAKKVGYPVMIKAVSGGGGKGMRVVHRPEEFLSSLEACRREAHKSFGKDAVLIEKYLINPRHIEVQVFGDRFGNAVHLYERDCSVQRRHQKVLEESPAPGLAEEVRQAMGAAAVAAAKAVGYVGAGTVEFLLDPETQDFYFCEMNCRLQVEHPVTEMVVGQDLVEWQLRVASGQALPITEQAKVVPRGHAIEARIYAENPGKGFLPATGTFKWLKTPEVPVEHEVRVETGVVEGDVVSVYYDPMIAKLLTWAPTRAEALNKMAVALRDYQIGGLPNNLDFLHRCVTHPAFVKGGVNTGFLVDYADDVSMPKPASPSSHLLAVTAFAIMAGREGAKKGSSPWMAAGPWRSFRPRTVVLDLKLDGWEQPSPVRVTCHCGGQAFTVETIPSDGKQYHVTGRVGEGGDVEAVVDGVLYHAKACVDDGDLASKTEVQIWLRSNGLVDDEHKRHTFSMTVPGLQFGEGGGEGSGPRVVSPMPGRVIKVLVKGGDEVKRGQAMVILEAMKMEHVIAAPSSGTVQVVGPSVGDLVEEGAALVSLTTTAAAAT